MRRRAVQTASSSACRAHASPLLSLLASRPSVIIGGVLLRLRASPAGLGYRRRRRFCHLSGRQRRRPPAQGGGLAVHFGGVSAPAALRPAASAWSPASRRRSQRRTLAGARRAAASRAARKRSALGSGRGDMAEGPLLSR